MIKEHGKLDGLSKYLVEQATQDKEISVDNITLIVIDVAALMEYKQIEG